MKKAQRDTIMETTRQRLLQAAAEEFAHAGYAGANINTISTKAGFAKGTIYNYFASKRDLLLELMDDTAQQHLEFITTQVRSEVDPARRLERFYRAGFEFVVQFLAPALVLFNTINGPDEVLKAHLFEAYQPMFQFVANEIIGPGIEQKAFRPVDPDATALLLMNIYLGTATQLNDQGRPWLDPRQVAELVIYGLHQAAAAQEDLN